MAPSKPNDSIHPSTLYQLRLESEVERVATRLGLVTTKAAAAILGFSAKSVSSYFKFLEQKHGLSPMARYKGRKLYRISDIHAARRRSTKAIERSDTRQRISRQRLAMVEAYAQDHGLMSAGQIVRAMGWQGYGALHYLKLKGLVPADSYKGWPLYRLEDVQKLSVTRGMAKAASHREVEHQLEVLASQDGLVSAWSYSVQHGISLAQAKIAIRRMVRHGLEPVGAHKGRKLYRADDIEQADKRSKSHWRVQTSPRQ